MSEPEVQELAANIFLDAAQYIREYGWQVEGMGREGEARCSMGALASAYPKPKWDKELSDLMYLSLYKELRDISLTRFNHTYKSGEKVARLYEHVASRLRTKLTLFR